MEEGGRMKIKRREEGSQKMKEEAWRNMMLGLCLLFMSTIKLSTIYFYNIFSNLYSIYNLPTNYSLASTI